MPTKHRRIAIVEDEELAGSLAKVSELLEGRSRAGLVRELAMRGAERVLEEQRGRREALERLAEWSTTPGALDLDALRAARASWGEPDEW